MTDLLNEIDRRMKYLDRYLPQGRRVPVTNEERAQRIIKLQENVLAGRASALERERYELLYGDNQRREGSASGSTTLKTLGLALIYSPGSAWSQLSRPSFLFLLLGIYLFTCNSF